MKMRTDEDGVKDVGVDGDLDVEEDVDVDGDTDGIILSVV